MKHEDSIVSPTLSPYTRVDLGARSLVSGVDCSDPEKFPLLEIVCSFNLARHRDVMHHLHVHFFYIIKIIFPKSYFVFAIYSDGLINLHYFLIFEIKTK
jgi:hypothetical protein